ncbi:hypothetical protein IC229_05745 [Spirosoma sp. BT702]|uniref:Uncharacterized protein n=1 Tax=Spirosoma profusum TaxID=2771354 RepID=A0A926XYF6_9BACT|nr:hypothetical protein [Spirosoma profusum]MBD2700128.1 hypothetical protein [Spirosoma profusum]
MMENDQSNFRCETVIDTKTNQKVANFWTLTLSDWMAHQFQQTVFPFLKIGFSQMSIRKTDDGRTQYQFMLDDEASLRVKQALYDTVNKDRLN